MKMERVLVTGGAGFIGSHLVDRLILDHEVVVLDDLSGGNNFIKPHIGEKNFTFIEGSVASNADTKKALDGVTTVFHLAAQPDVRLSVTDPMSDFNVNIIGGMNFLEEVRYMATRKYFRLLKILHLHPSVTMVLLSVPSRCIFHPIQNSTE